ncbi:MAG TPA: CPBP family intramembrane glutamic endopeptidase [Polyangiaceae bacterium]|nr:CPBP family intramembrane glutamic endopeptidase [Polyangiaceae bacterium]
MSGERRRQLSRLFAVITVWALSFQLLSRYGVDLLPRSFARELTLEAYLAIVQIVTLCIGVALSFVLLHDPRRDLALYPPQPGAAAYAVALTPAVFVLSTGAAFQIAEPTLLAELVRGGMKEVQKNTGEFGRELTASPAWLAFAWGAVVSPIAEEAFFRGAFFTFVRDATAFGGVRSAEPGALSPELLEQGALVRAGRGAFLWLGRGGAATLIVALVFGWLHHDMPGGLGIVRFVSALGLGVACGFSRQWSASVVPPMLVHVGFNALSLATARHLVVSGSFPVKSGVPTLVAAVGGALAWAVALHYLLRRRAPA